MPRSDSADSQSQAIQEEPLPSTSNEDEDPLAGKINCSPIYFILFYHFKIFKTMLPHDVCDVFVSKGISLPEGVDPSFLAALPEDIRREVLQNQLGIRPPSRPPVATSLPSTTAPVLGGPGVTEVSPEFLAALPPAIQEEVRLFTKTLKNYKLLLKLLR